MCFPDFNLTVFFYHIWGNVTWPFTSFSNIYRGRYTQQYTPQMQFRQRISPCPLNITYNDVTTVTVQIKRPGPE